MTNSRIEMPLGLRWAMAGFLFIGLASNGLALAAEPLRKVRMAIPSVVIDFAPLWIARERGIFRDERIDPEITYIQGNVRVVQSLVAGEVQFGIAGTAGAVSARAAGEEVIIVAVPMNRLDYTFVSRQPINKPADLTGKKVGIGAVGGSDEVATRIALEKLGIKIGDGPKRWLGRNGWSYALSPHMVRFESEEEGLLCSLRYEFCLNEPAMVVTLTLTNRSGHPLPLEVYTHLKTTLRTCQTYARKESAWSSFDSSANAVVASFDDSDAARATMFVMNAGSP